MGRRWSCCRVRQEESLTFKLRLFWDIETPQRPDGRGAGPVFSGIHHPADVGFLRRIQAVSGFLLPQHLNHSKKHAHQ